MKPVKKSPHEPMLCVCRAHRYGAADTCVAARYEGVRPRFYCPGCKRFVPWCRGAHHADDARASSLCDGCWAREYAPTGATT